MTAGSPRLPCLMTGAESLTAALHRWNYSTVFAYPGTSELALCAAIDRTDGLTLVNARGDKEAAFMAAGGNLRGGRCAAILHGARGLTNALGAVADVRRSEVPVLYLVGMPSRSSARYLPSHGEDGLINRAGAFAKDAFDCSDMDSLDAKEFLAIVGDALHAVEGRPFGPVLLGIPQDVLTAQYVPPDLLADSLADMPPSPEPDIAEALTLIGPATTPAILVDDYLLRSPTAEADLATFAARLGASVFQVAYRRGVPRGFQTEDLT